MSQELLDIFKKQQETAIKLRLSNASLRKAKLRRLKQLIEENEQLIFKALAQDLGKSTFESALTEVYFVYAEITFALKNLNFWMRPKRVSSTVSALLSKSRIVYEPKGTSLIIAPWNYPFQLLMSPLVSAIAAGNTAILKPSEISSATSKLVADLINKNFPAEEIFAIEGDVQVAQELLELPFDHIVFTLSTAVGKVVMQAAAKHLSTVTLELGGKSPAIIL